MLALMDFVYCNYVYNKGWPNARANPEIFQNISLSARACNWAKWEIAFGLPYPASL
jgi:hypothetical protein